MSSATRIGARFATALCVALLALLCVSPVSAQQVGGEPGADVARLRAQLEALQERVKTLEDERGKATAPFRVVDAGGRTIVTVDADGSGGAALVVGNAAGSKITISTSSTGGQVAIGSGSNTLAELSGRPGQAALTLKDSRTAASFTASGAQPGLAVNKGDVATVKIVSGADGGAIETADDNGQPNAAITGRGAFLYDNQGRTYFEAGFAPDTSKPIVVVGDRGTNARVEIGAGTAGDGSYVWVFDGKTQVPRVNLLANSKGAQVGVSNTEGKTAFFAGAGPTTEGKVRLIVGASDKGARFEAGELKAGGGSYLSLYDAANTELGTLTVDPTGSSLFEIKANDKSDLLLVQSASEGGTPRLVLGDQDKARVELGLTKGAEGSYVSLFDQTNKERAAITALTDASSLELLDMDGSNIFTVKGGVTPGVPRLTLGEREKAHAEIGLTTGEAGSYVSLFDQTNAEVISLTGEKADPNLIVSQGEVRTIVGNNADKKMGFFIENGMATLVSVRGSEEGGRVVASNAAGVPTAGLINTKDGGQLLVTGPQGTNTQVGINGSADGGQIKITDAKGETRVFAEGQKNGKVQVTGPGGFIVLEGGEAAPKLQIMDEGGNVMVQAGIGAKEGVGVVMTGPGGNGVAAALTGGRAASSINGKAGGN